MKRLARADALGHWGTLDPGVCGVLLLGLGKATRLFPLLRHSRKRYVFELKAGARTSTADASGEIVARSDVPGGWWSALAKVVPTLIGPLEQLPPMHSAVKVQGRPLYRSARAGVFVERKDRPTHIYDLRMLPTPNHSSSSARLFVECAAGTYVRTLCEDLGARIGVAAHMGALVRLSSGDFHAEAAALPHELAHDVQACFLDPLPFLDHPRVRVDDRQARRFAHGGAVVVAHPAAMRAASDSAASQEWLVLSSADELLGTARASTRDGMTLLAPTRVLTGADDTPAEGASGEEANE